MGEHISNAELSLFAHDKLSFERDRRDEIESHIANCAECGASFDFYSVAEEDDLVGLAVWQPIIGSTFAAMSAYANKCAAEDTEADELLKDYFETRARRRWRTSGTSESSTPAVWCGG